MPGIDRNHHHTVTAANVIVLVVVYAEQKDIGDGVIVVQTTQQVGISGDLIRGRSPLPATGQRNRSARRGKRTQTVIMDLAQKHIRIHQAAAKDHKNQAQKQNNYIADQTNPLLFLIILIHNISP